MVLQLLQQYVLPFLGSQDASPHMCDFLQAFLPRVRTTALAIGVVVAAWMAYHSDAADSHMQASVFTCMLMIAWVLHAIKLVGRWCQTEKISHHKYTIQILCNSDSNISLASTSVHLVIQVRAGAGVAPMMSVSE